MRPFLLPIFDSNPERPVLITIAHFFEIEIEWLPERIQVIEDVFRSIN